MTGDTSDDSALASILGAEQMKIDRPSPGRVYDYLLGGATNFAVDREFAHRITTLIPELADYAKTNRRFLRRAVINACEEGLTQFVDLGSGIPTVGNVHEVADRTYPESRVHVVYVDNEPVSVAHAELLLARSADPSRHKALHGDLLDYRQVWEQILATGLVDLSRPVVLLAVAVLHFIKDEAHPHEAFAFYRAQLPPGSWLVMSTVTNQDVADETEAKALAQLAELYENTTSPGQIRDAAEFEPFFGSWPLLAPGLTWAPAWRPEPEMAEPFDRPSQSRMLVGVARKPG